MNTRLLFIISLCVTMLAVWFYRSQDKIEIHTPMSTTNIEYEATQIDAVQTGEQGQVTYLLAADQAIHYSDKNEDRLTNLEIDWRPNVSRQVQLRAEQGVLNQNTGEVRMMHNVMFVSIPPTPDTDMKTDADISNLPMKMNAQEIIGNLNTNQLHSDMPIVISQGNNHFESDKFNADLETGEYEFSQVAVVFEPPKRQDVPLF